MKNQKTKSLNVRLNEIERKRLEYVSDKVTGNLSSTLRLLINKAYRELQNKKVIEVMDN